MSKPLTKGDVLFRQRMLACAGFYKKALDGVWGDGTEAADVLFAKEFERIKKDYGTFDLRSEGILVTLLPKMQIASRKLLALAKSKKFPHDVKLLSGTRTYDEQNALYEKRPKVTNAKGGQSNHNFSIAIDVGIFDGSKYYTGATRTEEKAYDALAVLVKPNIQELEWGGDWKSIVDKPHYQYRTGKSTSEVRALFERGVAYI